jgi:hypothetical protein
MPTHDRDRRHDDQPARFVEDARPAEAVVEPALDAERLADRVGRREREDRRRQERRAEQPGGQKVADRPPARGRSALAASAASWIDRAAEAVAEGERGASGSGRRAHQIWSGSIAIAPAGHSAAQMPQPLQ